MARPDRNAPGLPPDLPVSRGFNRQASGAVRQLTPCELQVLAAAASGLTRRQTADLLGMHPANIRSHLAHTYHALRVPPGSSAAAAAVALAIHSQQLAINPAGQPPPQLTPRQHEVLTGIARGRSNARIAEHLALREDAVKRHIQRLMTLLDARSRAHLVAVGFQRGLLRPPADEPHEPPDDP